MSVPRWQTQLQSLLDRHAHLPYARFVSAATVRTDGRPANRMLTFRGLQGNGCLVFTTDVRAEKAAQLAANSAMELCWYFTEVRIQLRLLGTATIAASDDTELAALHMQAWRERTEQSRQAFTWPDPGQVLAPQISFELPSPQLPPDHFALLLFQTQQVDTLELSPHPHRRCIHSLENGNWIETPINP